jgi:hypothetical protein
METQITVMKPLLAFALAGLLLLFASLLLLFAIYSALAYYRLVRIAKGIKPYGWIRSRNFFQPKAECSISKSNMDIAFQFQSVGDRMLMTI